MLTSKLVLNVSLPKGKWALKIILKLIAEKGKYYTVCGVYFYSSLYFTWISENRRFNYGYSIDLNLKYHLTWYLKTKALFLTDTDRGTESISLNIFKAV